MSDATRAPLRCKDCGQWFVRPSNMGPAPGRCLKCRRKAKAKRTSGWHGTNPEKVWAHKRRHAPVTHPVCVICGVPFVRESMKGTIPRWCPACKPERERMRTAATALRHRCAAKGVTVERYQAALSDQGGRCAICRGGFGVKGPQIDHDHACCSGAKGCGECFRGLLCVGCNHALGNLHDDIKIILAAARYALNGGTRARPVRRIPRVVLP